MWLEADDAKSASEDERDAVEHILALKGYNINMPQPEPFYILRMLKNANTSYWAGGLADQPYFLLRELNAAGNGERKFLDRKTANLKRMIDANG